MARVMKKRSIWVVGYPLGARKGWGASVSYKGKTKKITVGVGKLNRLNAAAAKGLRSLGCPSGRAKGAAVWAQRTAWKNRGGRRRSTYQRDGDDSSQASPSSPIEASRDTAGYFADIRVPSNGRYAERLIRVSAARADEFSRALLRWGIRYGLRQVAILALRRLNIPSAIITREHKRLLG